MINDNFREWWLTFRNYPDEMVCVTDDSCALQNIMKTANMQICEKCCKEYLGEHKRWLHDLAFMDCPEYKCESTRLDLTTATSLPNTCKYKMEHIVAFNYCKGDCNLEDIC